MMVKWSKMEVEGLALVSTVMQVLSIHLWPIPAE